MRYNSAAVYGEALRPLDVAPLGDRLAHLIRWTINWSGAQALHSRGRLSGDRRAWVAVAAAAHFNVVSDGSAVTCASWQTLVA